MLMVFNLDTDKWKSIMLILKKLVYSYRGIRQIIIFLCLLNLIEVISNENISNNYSFIAVI